MHLYDIEVRTIEGKTVSLATYAGKTLLVVNTASGCGLTPQFEGLESLYRKFRGRGLVVLGFPCNQFAGQEPLDEKAIQEFCTSRYDVTFPLFAKIDVNGKDQHPLYAYLKEQAPGILGLQAIKWNFTKFLVDAEGRVVDRFGPQEAPESLAGRIEERLTQGGRVQAVALGSESAGS